MKRSSKRRHLFIPEWADVKGYEGHYQVSNTGEVRSVTRTLPHGGARGGLYTHKGKPVVQRENSCGYLRVNLCVNNKRKKHFAHRLVAEHFLVRDEERLHINHKDCNKTNNTATNLEWCTPSENIQHRNAQ